MRTLIILLVGAGLGFLFGNVQVTAFKDERPHKIGLELDEFQRRALDQLDADKEEIAKTGVIPAEALARVEVIGGTDFDFGTMKRGTNRSHEFIIKNNGAAPLTLKVINSTCKCTVGTIENQEVKPGEQTPVKLTWHAEGILPDFAQTATIGTNDPAQKEIKLTITGRIGQNYVIVPDSLQLGEFSSHEKVVKEFKFYSYEDVPLEVGGYWGDVTLTDAGIVEVEREVSRVEPGSIPEHADARYMADFKVTINPGMTAGPINGFVRLIVGPDELPLAVPVTGRCISDLRIVGGPTYDAKENVFSMGTFSGEEGGFRNIYIQALSDGKDVTLEVDRIVPDYVAPHLKIEFGEPISKDKMKLYPTKIGFEPGTPPIDRDGSNPGNYVKVFFKSNLEHSPEIALYLKFKVE